MNAENIGGFWATIPNKGALATLLEPTGPNFTGGEAGAITKQVNSYIFRTSFTQDTAMPKVVRYIAGC